MTLIWKHITIAAVMAFFLVGFGPMSTTDLSIDGLTDIAGGVAPAEAARRRPPPPPPGAGRRVARRTARRVARRHSIAGCSPYNAYYNCGGVYYRPIVENGVTVYVVVNP